MLEFIENILKEFRHCFTREKAYKWFVICVISLMIRSDHLGVTTVIRDLALDPKCYESLIHFFRSAAYSNSALTAAWQRVVSRKAPLVKCRGRVLLVGDGVKQTKEARHMPGVKKMVQESETSSKPEYIHGHLLGALGIIASNGLKRFCIPLKINVQDGIRAAASWEEAAGIVDISAESHVEQMVRLGYEAAKIFGPSYLILDRYFLTRPALSLMDRLNAAHADDNPLEIITKAKINCGGFMKPKLPARKKRGRPPKRGNAVKLAPLFDQKQRFQKATVWVYGKREEVSYYCINLLWGPGLYKELRFVLVELHGTRSILVSTDTTLSPIKIIEHYARRFSCEELFREMKQQLGAFCYHFWTKSMPKLNHFARKEERDTLCRITDSEERIKILKTIKAIESYVACACVAMGTLQMISLLGDDPSGVCAFRYLRTYSSACPSEATLMYYLRKHIFLLLPSQPDSFITRFIIEKQPAAGAGGSGNNEGTAA